MRAVIQRVRRCRVTIESHTTGEIGPGLLVLLGVGESDTEAAADYLAKKVLDLRIFEDDTEKMNLSVQDKKGGVLVISQFTLYGDTRARGHRLTLLRGPKKRASCTNTSLKKFVPQACVAKLANFRP